MYTSVVLKPGKEESLLRFHPWVFSGAIRSIDGPAEEGDVVSVVSSAGTHLATGHYQRGTIAVRVLSFEPAVIDREFFLHALQTAYAKRLAIPSTSGSETFRLVHGEGDGLPGLIIDVYGDTAVVQAHSIGIHRSRILIAEALMEVMKGRVENVFYKSEGTLGWSDEVEDGYIIGQQTTAIATENSLRFHIDWLEGQKTGFFIDQRDNRALLEQYARGRKVLNMFCYTGGFSVYALRGGAVKVDSVDASQKAIDLTLRNVALNFPGDTRHEAFCEDAFHTLSRIDRSYDLIILDPPAFAKHRAALHNALKGYTRLNRAAFEKIAPDSVLFTFSCSQIVSKEHFRNAVFTAAAQARRKVSILHQLHQPADHPVNLFHPEGEYLKGLVLYVE